MNVRKWISVLLIFVLLITMTPSYKIQAAKKKVKLNKTKVTLKVGKSYKLKLKNNKKKVKWTVISGKKYVKLKSKKKTGVMIVAKKKGTAKVQAKVGKKKYVCKVTVKKESKKITASENEATQAPTVTQTPAPVEPSTTPTPIGPTSTPTGMFEETDNKLKYIVSGIVTLKSGMTLPKDLEVGFVKESSLQYYTAQRDLNGKYEIALEEGSYSISVDGYEVGTMEVNRDTIKNIAIDYYLLSVYIENQNVPLVGTIDGTIESQDGTTRSCVRETDKLGRLIMLVEPNVQCYYAWKNVDFKSIIADKDIVNETWTAGIYKVTGDITIGGVPFKEVMLNYDTEAINTDISNYIDGSGGYLGKTDYSIYDFDINGGSKYILYAKPGEYRLKMDMDCYDGIISSAISDSYITVVDNDLQGVNINFDVYPVKLKLVKDGSSGYSPDTGYDYVLTNMEGDYTVYTRFNEYDDVDGYYWFFLNSGIHKLEMKDEETGDDVSVGYVVASKEKTEEQIVYY